MISIVTERKWKWRLLSCVQLCDAMDYTVHEILQARILEWAAFPFSRGSFQSRDRTQVSSITGGFFNSWATREAQKEKSNKELTWKCFIYPMQRRFFGVGEGVILAGPKMIRNQSCKEWGKGILCRGNTRCKNPEDKQKHIQGTKYQYGWSLVSTEKNIIKCG